MKNILTIARGINVLPLALSLARNPQLWNTRKERTQQETSPHREIDDIWVRYAKDWQTGETSHESVWLEAADCLPEVKDHARAIMGLVKGDAIGGILITRIPPGGKVHPHIDNGWHALQYDKFALQIDAHQQQAFCFENAQHVTMPGDLYWFNNQQTHWVTNDSPCERITLIVCIKLDKPFGG